jgi:hypothetical protein
MANAIKEIAKFIKRNPESPEATVLWEMCKALESKSGFELHRLFDLKLRSFELAMELLNDWRLDRWIAERRIQKYIDLSDD